MGVSVSLEILDGVQLRRRLGVIKEGDVPRSRRRLVRRVSRSVIERTVENNPVDTARSRAAWVESLEQLGGQGPPDWQGPHPEGTAIGEGRSRGGVQQLEATELTEIQATNAVDYINYLEFGTRKMSPFQMVERSLRSVRPAISRQPFFCAPADELGIF